MKKQKKFIHQKQDRVFRAGLGTAWPGAIIRFRWHWRGRQYQASLKDVRRHYLLFSDRVGAECWRLMVGPFVLIVREMIDIGDIKHQGSK